MAPTCSIRGSQGVLFPERRRGRIPQRRGTGTGPSQHRPHRRMPPGPARVHGLRRPGVVGSAVPPGPTGVLRPPGPLRWSGALDLSLVSRPACAITGRIGVAGVEYRLTEQPAMTCHYWGRNLPSQWVWLSGRLRPAGNRGGFGLIRSRLWGARVPLPRAGYAWLTTDSGQRLVVSPITGLVRCHGDRSGAAVAVTVHAPRAARGFLAARSSRPGIVRRPRRGNRADPACPVPDPVAVRTYHVHRPGGAGVPRRPPSMTATRSGRVLGGP